MLERHGEEIKKKLEEFAEIMKKEHVRRMIFALCVGIKISKHCRQKYIKRNPASVAYLDFLLI